MKDCKGTCEKCACKTEVDHSAPVKPNTTNKLVGNYKPEKNIYYREVDNRQIKSRGQPC